MLHDSVKGNSFRSSNELGRHLGASFFVQNQQSQKVNLPHRNFPLFVCLKIERWLCSFEEKIESWGRNVLLAAAEAVGLSWICIRWARQRKRRETPLNVTTSIKVTKSIRRKMTTFSRVALFKMFPLSAFLSRQIVVRLVSLYSSGTRAFKMCVGVSPHKLQ